MKATKWILSLTAAATMTLASSSFAFDRHQQSDTPSVDEIRLMSQPELDDLYANAEPGPMPDGDSQGTAVFFPGSLINVPAQILASLFWQGKIFDTDEGVLVNKVFGFKAIKAELYRGESLFDGGEANIIDYHDTSLVARSIRDEIREISPGVYLGRAYMRTLFLDIMVVNFILDFN